MMESLRNSPGARRSTSALVIVTGRRERRDEGRGLGGTHWRWARRAGRRARSGRACSAPAPPRPPPTPPAAAAAASWAGRSSPRSTPAPSDWPSQRVLMHACAVCAACVRRRRLTHPVARETCGIKGFRRVRMRSARSRTRTEESNQRVTHRLRTWSDLQLRRSRPWAWWSLPSGTGSRSNASHLNTSLSQNWARPERVSE